MDFIARRPNFIVNRHHHDPPSDEIIDELFMTTDSKYINESILKHLRRARRPRKLNIIRNGVQIPDDQIQARD